VAHETLAASSLSVFHTTLTLQERVVLIYDAAQFAELRQKLCAHYESQLPFCSFELPGGGQDAIPCPERAQVHSLVDDMPYCRKHFALAVRRG
jgi:hypothetical protein